MLLKKNIVGILICSSFALSLETHTDGKPIYEPMDNITVTPMNVTVSPINVTVTPLNVTLTPMNITVTPINVTIYPIGENDNDEDGIPNNIEEDLNLNPNSTDSDHDGISDSIEIGDMFNPTDTDNDGIIDALDDDSDDDGVSDRDEHLAGTDPQDDTDYPTGMSKREKALFMILRHRSNQIQRENRELNSD